MTSIKGVAHKSRLFHFYLCQCIFDYCCSVKLMVKSNMPLERSSLATKRTPRFCRICRSTYGRLLPKGRKNLAERKTGNLPLELRSLATEGTQEFPPLKNK